MISEFEDSFEVRKEAKGERYNTTENSVVRSRDVGALYRKLKMPDAVERRQHCGLVQLRWVTREREREPPLHAGVSVYLTVQPGCSR